MKEKKAQEKNSLKKTLNHSVSANKLSYNSSETIKFNKQEIVWAKITGYPWWPAIVTTVPGQKDIDRKNDDMRNYYPWSNVHHNVKAQYRVDFIADETHAFLKKSFLLNYLQNRDRLYVEGLQFSTRKRRFFQMAVSEADQLQQVLELSKNQVYQCKHNKQEQSSDSIQSQQNSQESESEDEQNSNSSESQNSSQNQSQGQSQKQSTPQNRFTRLKKLKKSGNKGSQQQSKSIPKQGQNQFQNKYPKINIQKNKISNQKPVKVPGRRGRPPRRSSIITQNDTKPQNSLNKCEVIKKDLFVKFQIEEKNLVVTQKNTFLKQNKIPQEKQFFYEQIQVAQSNQNVERSGIVEGANPLTQSNQIKSEHQKTQSLVSQLMTKYNLHKIDEAQENYKNNKILKNKEETMSTFQNAASMKGYNNKLFVKNIFSGLGKKKQSKKQNNQKQSFSQHEIFAENLSIIGKLKQNDEDKISQDQKSFLIETSKKHTARKIYSTVLNILKKNNIESIDHQVQQNIKQRCKTLSNIIFDQDQDQIFKSQKKSSSNNKKKCQNNNETYNFLTSFKKKLEQNVNFVRFFSLQNWDLLSQMSSFSTDLCISIKSFQIYLEKNCNLIMRNQQKFQDIVKQISIENQKTAFTCLHPPIEMEIQNDSINQSSGKFVSQEQNQCIKIKKKTQNICIETL